MTASDTRDRLLAMAEDVERAAHSTEPWENSLKKQRYGMARILRALAEPGEGLLEKAAMSYESSIDAARGEPSVSLDDLLPSEKRESRNAMRAALNTIIQEAMKDV